MLHVILFAQLLSGAARVPVEAYYRRCFGRVAIAQRGFGPRPLAYPGQTLHTIAAIALALDMLKAAFLPPAVRGISLAGIGLMAGSLWIVVRDWPLAGALAALIAATLHMSIDRIGAPEWALLFLALVSAAMLFEGVLDRRLEAGNANVLPSWDAEHAHTV